MSVSAAVRRLEGQRSQSPQQSELGFIPPDWTVRAGSEVFSSVASGRSRAGSDLGPHPLHGSTGIIGRCDKPDYSGRAILVARVGANAGRISSVDGQYGVTDNTIILRVSSNLDFRFIKYLTEAKRLHQLSFGSGQPLVTGTQIKALKFAIPPAQSEQVAIAEALSEVETLIDKLESLIEKKRAVKSAALQELLTGQRRLPGFGKSWNTAKLGSLGVFIKGSGVRKDQAQSGDLPCVRYGEIYTDHSDVIRFFRSFISRTVAATATRIRTGDILFAGSGETKEEIGKCVAVPTVVEAYAGGDIIILRTSGHDPTFLGYALNQPSVSRQKASKGQGDAVVHISARALSEVEVLLPDLPEQIAISTAINDMDDEAEVLLAQLVKYRRLRQGMMQELLTGRVRLV